MINGVDRYGFSIKLRRVHGFRGYGLYLRIIELIHATPTKTLSYNVDDLAFDTREEVEFIRDVVENFNLFTIENETLIDPFTRTPELIAAEQAAAAHAKRSEAAKRAAATRKARQQPKPEPETPLLEQEPDETGEPPRSDLSRRFDEVTGLWNKQFTQPRRQYRDLVPDAITWNNFTGSAQQYKSDDFRDAFEQASRDKFPWVFRDAIKPTNMARLLASFEASKQQKRRENELNSLTGEPLDFATREMIEYGDKHGLNWNHAPLNS